MCLGSSLVGVVDLDRKSCCCWLLHQQSLVLEQSRRLEWYRQTGHFFNHVVVLVHNFGLGNQQVVKPSLAHLVDDFVFNLLVIVDKAEVPHTGEGASFNKMLVCALTNTESVESCVVIDSAVLLDKLDNSTVVVNCTIGQQVNVGFHGIRFRQVDLSENVNKGIVNFCAPEICFKLSYLL